MTTPCRTLSVALAGLALMLSACGPGDASVNPPEYPGRVVWSAEEPDFGTGDVSRDGRYFSDINWTTGDLDIVDLESGAVRPLTGEGYDAGGNAWGSAFSTDGRRLAVAWYDYETGTYALRVEAVDGTDSRLLIPAEAGGPLVEPLDWTPDDRAIVVSRYQPEGDWQLATVSVEDGTVRVLRTLGWEAPGGLHPQAYPRARVSPQGDLLGFDYPSPTPENGQDVYAIGLDDAEMHVVVSGPGHDRFAAWTPDGMGVLFYSDRSGQPALWRQAIADRAPSGPPTMVADAVPGITPMGMTVHGFAYAVPESTPTTYIASVDYSTGAVTSGPTPVDQNPWNRNTLGDWSPDGSALLYIRFGSLPDPAESAILVAPGGDELRRVPFPHDWHNKTGKVSWIADDFVLVDGDLKGRSHLHRFNPVTGEVTRLPDYGERGLFVVTEASPDGAELYVVVTEGEPRILGIDTDTGEQRVVAQVRLNAATLAASPTGDALAYLTPSTAERPASLEVLHLDTGERTPVPVTVAGRLDQPVAWTPDGRQLLVGLRRDDADATLLLVSADPSHPPMPVALPDAVGNFLRIASPGGHLAFQGGLGIGTLRFLAEY